MHPRRHRSPWPLAALAAVVVLFVGVWFGGHPSWLPGPVRSAFVSQSDNDKLINQVLGLIQRDYYRKVSRTALVNAGLAGTVASLDDPYSHYYDPTDYQSFQNADTTHLSGIGVDINPSPRGLVVVDVFQGSPAARGGLAAGDVITAVGSTSLAGRSSTASAKLITGRAGTPVTLTVVTGRHTRRVTLTRANLVIPVASGLILRYKGIKLGYVQLTTFSQGSGAELRYQVQSVLHQGARGLILDLRENGGGLIEEAVNVASIFISNGTIVSTYGRSQPRQVYLAHGDAIAPTIPLVVLVDENTASSAEIVTAALQQRGRAKVVGTHTYGKGVFQEIDPLPNGGALDFTVGEFFTPDGENLGAGGVVRGRGVIPNVYAFTKPGSRTDTALTAAERTVAAEVTS